MSETNIQWKKFDTDVLSIMLPDTFIGGDPKKDKKAILEEINKQSEKYQPNFKAYFQKKEPKIPFKAVDVVVDDSFTFFTSLTVCFDNIPLFMHSMKIEKYLQEAKKRLGRNVNYIEEGISATQNYSAARLVIFEKQSKGLFRAPGEVIRKVLLYSIKMRTRFWDFFYSAKADIFDDLVPVFEKSIDSVVIKID